MVSLLLSLYLYSLAKFLKLEKVFESIIKTVTKNCQEMLWKSCLPCVCRRLFRFKCFAFVRAPPVLIYIVLGDSLKILIPYPNNLAF